MSPSRKHSFNDDLNNTYMDRVREAPMLSQDEEFELAKKWRENGDQKAIDKIISSHMRLVNKIAAGYKGYGLPLNDLVSEGHVGMMQAMKHFDPEKGYRFSTYASWWIRAAVQEYILHTWSLVKIGTTTVQKKLFFSLRKERENLLQIDSTQMTSEIIQKIAHKLSVKESEVMDMIGRLHSDHSLNAPVKTSTDEGGGSEWQDWLEDERDNHETQALERNAMERRHKILSQALSILNPREQEIIKQRRLHEPPATLDTLSETLNITRERVRQIEINAFTKLRKALKNEQLL